MSRRAVVLGFVAVACGGALAGCGGGGAATPAATAAKPAGAADEADAPVATHAAAKPKSTLRPLPAIPDTIGPLEYRREVFRYAGGSRDPFQSLVTSNSLGPEIGDLTLVSVTYDARYEANSVAIIRARNHPSAYRVHRGDRIGRMRVIRIRQHEVVFQIEELGFQRDTVLALRRREEAR